MVNQQSLTTATPSSSAQFAHYLSLTSSKSDTQRRDALSYLCSHLSSRNENINTTIILPKLLPLILDGSASVRTQLLRFLRLLPASDIGDRAETVLLYVRAGMTHLASEIRNDGLSVLEWLLEIAGEYVVSCPGGWVKTLKCFMSMMGWATSKKSSKWTSESKASFGRAGKEFSRQLNLLSRFLKAGLVEPEDDKLEEGKPLSGTGRQPVFPLTDVNLHIIPRRSNAYTHLNLFGTPRDEDGEIYSDRESRQRVFAKLFQATVENGVDMVRKEGGDAGRAAAVVLKNLQEGMSDYYGV